MRYMLICNNCGQKHFTNGANLDLFEVKTAPLPKNANGLSKEMYDLPKRYKCYNCGMLFKIVKNKEATEKKEEAKEENLPIGDDYLKQWENESLKSIRKKKS